MSPLRLLSLVWVGFMTITGVISLASLTDDLIIWNSFVISVINEYRAIRSIIWIPLFNLLRLDLPEYFQDYMTLHSIFLTAVVWAFYNARSIGNFSNLGSPWKFAYGNMFSWTLGGGYLKSFREKALRLFSQHSIELGAYPTKQSIDALTSGRTPRKDGAVQLGLAAVITASILTCSFLLPAILKFADAVVHRSSIRTFEKRFSDFINGQSMSNAPDNEFWNSVTVEFREFIAWYKISEETDKFFHSLIREAILQYFSALFGVFCLLIVVNYFAKAAGYI